MPNGPHRITGLPFEEELYSSEHSVKDTDIQVSSFDRSISFGKLSFLSISIDRKIQKVCKIKLDGFRKCDFLCSIERA